MKKVDTDFRRWDSLADFARRAYQMFHDSELYMYWDNNTCKPVVMFTAYTSVDLDTMCAVIKAIELEDVDDNIRLAWYRLYFAMIEFKQVSSSKDIISFNWALF